MNSFPDTSIACCQNDRRTAGARLSAIITIKESGAKSVLRLLKKYGAEIAFDPDDVALLVAAFDDAWSQLEKSGARFESSKQRELARNLLGKHIIEEAKQGERDQVRLRDNALLQYTKINLRSRSRT